MIKNKLVHRYLFLLFLLSGLQAVPASGQRPDKNGSDFNILRYGAAGDTSRLSTAAFNKAIEACHQAGGGRVIVPAGHYKSGTITLLDNVELFLERGAVIYASCNPADLPRQQQPAYRSQKDDGGWYSLIYAEGARNIGISGYGTIDGQGASQGPRFAGLDEDRDGRSRNILFISCKGVSVRDISMLNSGIWNQHYLDCEDLMIDHIRVYNHSNRNNDGIDIDGCRRVILSNSTFDSDDDGITLKSTGPAPCEDITITNCIASSFCNAIKCGTESTGGFRNIVISNCLVRPSRCPTEPIWKTHRIGQTGIALEIVDGGTMEGVTVDNIVVEGTDCPIYVRLGNRARPYASGVPTPPMGKMSNISISHVTAYHTGNYSCSVTGIPGGKIENIRLDHIRLVNKGGLKDGQFRPDVSKVAEEEKAYPDPNGWGNLPSYGFFIRHVQDISLSDISLSSLAPEIRTPIVAVDADRLSVSHLQSGFTGGDPVQRIGVKDYKAD